MSYIFCNVRRAKAQLQTSLWAFPQQSEEEIILTELWVGNTVQHTHIYKFFIRVWKISISMYRDGGTTNASFIGKPLLNQIYGSLLKIEIDCGTLMLPFQR